MLELAGVTFRYASGANALRGVSLNVEQGELVTVIGPNGSGKSTLARLIARAIEPASGEVRLLGRIATSWSLKEYARTVGYLPQEADIYLPMRALEVAEAGRAPFLRRFEWESEADRAIARRALAACDVAELEQRLVGEMSGGERKRVFLARVLAGEPRLMVLDEPFAAVDLAHVQQITMSLRASGSGVIAISHDVNWAAAASDRVVVLAGGVVVASGSPAEVITPSLMREVFGVSCEVVKGESGSLAVLPSFVGSGERGTYTRSPESA